MPPEIVLTGPGAARLTATQAARVRLEARAAWRAGGALLAAVAARIAAERAHHGPRRGC
jgi:hypothetical protein